MAGMGRFDIQSLTGFQRKLEKFNQNEVDAFLEDCTKELAARLLRMVVKRTPVGDYSHEITVTAKRDGKKHKKGEQYTKRVNPSGKKGGTLRRGWTGNHRQAAGSFADSLAVRRDGDNYIIEIVNPVEYASYVEYGHRTANHKGWVPGQFMMTISENELRDMAPRVLERRLKNFLGGVLS